MNATANAVRRLDEAGRASRRAATLSVLGFALVLTAICYAVVNLKRLERQRLSLSDEVAALRAAAEHYASQVTSTRQELIQVRAEYDTESAKLREDLQKARGALAASRAAISAFHAGHLEDAVALYDEALGADPDNAYLQNLRAYSLFRLGRVDAALEGQRRSIAADPTYAWGYFDLARFFCAAKPPRLNEARDAARKARELRPEMKSIMVRDGEFQRLCGHQVP